MNKERIKDLQKTLKANWDNKNGRVFLDIINGILEALLEEPKAVDVTPPVKPVKWRATIDGTYYYIDNVGEIDSECDSYDCWDDHRYLTGNYYKNEKEAEQALEVEKAKGRLDHAYYALVGDWKPDWNDYIQAKYFPKFDWDDEEDFVLDFCHTGQILNQYYFPTDILTIQFIKENLEDLKLVFNIQDSNE